MRLRKIDRFAPLLACVVLVACGGGELDEEDVARGEDGTAITTAGGEAVSEQALNDWNRGRTAYAEADRQGWNPDRCSSVIALFESAISEQGSRGFAEAKYMVGLTHHKCGDESAARRFYNQALQDNEKMCKARVAIGLLDLAGGNESQARAAFTRSIRDDPQCTAGYVNLAIMQREQGGNQEAEALRNLRRALAIESDYLPAFNQMALLYYNRGQQSGGAASLDLAEVVCRQAQIIDGDYAPIYNTWGLVKMEKGNVIEALRFFERAIQLNPDMFEAQMNFAQITLSFRGYEDAKNAFAKAVQLKDDNYEAHLGLGAALRGLQQFDQAKAEYERAIELDARRPEAYFNLGVLYHDYLSASVEDPIPPLRRAKQYYSEFMERAGNANRWEETVEGITRYCRDKDVSKEPRSAAVRHRNRMCRPGRNQLIDNLIFAMEQSAQMQREMEQMQQQQAAQEGGGE